MNKNALVLFLLINFVYLNCPDSDEYCVKCNGNKCEECRMSFLKDGVCQVVDNTVANCLTYSADGVCIRCLSGYFLSSSTKCDTNSIDKCQEPISTDQCRACEGQKLVSDTLKTCSDVSCTDTYCDLCSKNLGVEICIKCKSGYVLSTSNKCVGTTADTANCYSQSSSSVCKECLDGFFMKNSKCVLSSKYDLESSSKILIVFASILFLLFNQFD